MAKAIIIADSDKADQEEFRKVFETTDYQLIFSGSGEDALSRIKRFKPDLIIASGTSLQEMGGLELCGVVKRNPEFKHIPFILISNIFDTISEKDRQRVQADGMISKPLNEDEILNLVDHLIVEEAMGKKEEIVSKKHEESLLGLLGSDGEEDIIELLDIVEEPESRMSINDFIGTKKEEPFGEIVSLESWEGLELKEKSEEKEFVSYTKKEKEIIEEMDLQLKKEMAPKEATAEKDLFEKIDLEEVLDKVEQLKPSLEKEWPSEKELKVLEKGPPIIEEPTEKYLDLSEFELALRNEVETGDKEVEIEPFSFEIPKEEISEETLLTEEPLEEEEIGDEEKLVEEEELKELPEEEFPDELLEEILGEEEVSPIDEHRKIEPEEVKLEETQPELMRIEKLEEFEAPKIFGGEIEPLASQVSREIEEVSLVKVVDKHLEEVIGKGIQDMVGDFITKILPEMTQHIMGLTADRIEKMVREVIPDLAEKAIQEEIKRLKKGEKD
jgi:CheY-like chemotaxis protein